MKTCTVPQIGLRFDHLHLLLLQDEKSSFYPICISYWNTLTDTVWLCDQQLPAQGIPRQFCYLLLQFDACNVLYRASHRAQRFRLRGMKIELFMGALGSSFYFFIQLQFDDSFTETTSYCFASSLL